jgi:hypothetical protein
MIDNPNVDIDFSKLPRRSLTINELVSFLNKYLNPYCVTVTKYKETGTHEITARGLKSRGSTVGSYSSILFNFKNKVNFQIYVKGEVSVNPASTIWVGIGKNSDANMLYFYYAPKIRIFLGQYVNNYYTGLYSKSINTNGNLATYELFLECLTPRLKFMTVTNKPGNHTGGYQTAVTTMTSPTTKAVNLLWVNPQESGTVTDYVQRLQIKWMDGDFT